MLEATGLRFGYGRGPIIIEDVDLTLQQGEIVGLFGASGSGKSTILRLLAGLERPRAGCVRLDRGPVTGPTRAIGLMFQSYALFDWATSLDNIRFAMRMAGLRPTRTACVAQLEKVGLAASADALPGALSGGMRQRLALARAMSVQPRVLLLDEPFSALDSGTKATVMVDTMRHIRENGLAAMIVSHDPRALIPHCDRALMLVGSPASLARSPTVPDDLGPLRRSGASDPARVNLGIASAIEAVINGGRKERS